MLRKYLQAAMDKAHYEVLADDNTLLGTIPGFQGVYSNAPTQEACRDELEEVLEEWLFFRISQGMTVPEVDGIRLIIEEVV